MLISWDLRMLLVTSCDKSHVGTNMAMNYSVSN